MMRRTRPSILIAVLTAAMALPSSARAALQTFSVGGDNTTASILNGPQGVTAFRAALGNPDNLNAPGPLSSGHREINWDGGGATTGAAGPTPFTVFTNNRGGTFTTPGTGFLQTPVTDPLLTNINPSYATTFAAFSPQRIFTPTGSNITVGTFSIPGTNGATPAGVSGFGAIFSDVDLANTTRIQFFGLTGALLMDLPVPVGTVANASFSFLGLVGNGTPGELISRVQITTGNSALGPSDGGGIDVVVMDDFLFGEPVAIPEPASLTLGGSAAVIGLFLVRLRRRRRAR
jgi:hypothetical protein